MTKKSTVRNRITATSNRDEKDSVDKQGQRRRERQAPSDTFHLDIWLTLAIVNWIFDFGRPIAGWYVPLEWSPLNRPSIGDYFHMAYNVITPFCLLKLQERSPQKLSPSVSYISVITFVMGASIHLVGDSVNHRLPHVGYELHLSVRDNPIMQQLKPQKLVSLFELLYTYDEEIGHLMWYIPFFITLFLYFLGCFRKNNPSDRKLGLSWWLLLFVSSVYYWYLVTEGQIFSVYILTLGCMLVIWGFKAGRGERLDVNGLFLIHTFNVTFVLIVMWVVYLWNDPVLRQKYPGLVYIPEPWSYYSLHFVNKL
ncbi:ceroid-lipofuscinosis neuronal protein 6-like [Haliotis rubra]|uniref:ceroid-lipofuscinosis neuronal protein 6-like n=1 Tax=Haliotis rubra TaxID=36100 RepID=UPI001EE57DFD|nr:ceroid-lipofuscinosis neuronal protein 6-like [Haliotis rubra]